MPREQTVRILAEMVANVIAIDVSVGDEVAAGDQICLMESMKMEIPVLSEHGGTVATIKVAPGDVVQEGDVLVELMSGGGGIRTRG